MEEKPALKLALVIVELLDRDGVERDTADAAMDIAKRLYEHEWNRRQPVPAYLQKPATTSA